MKIIPLPNPLDAERRDIKTVAGRLAFYSRATLSSNVEDDRPLLLIHSINAAASAFEVKPLFDLYGQRNVYAFDLPGFGQSDRSDRPYTIETMTAAIIAVAEEIHQIHNASLDAVALSMSCEFLARATVQRPSLFRSLAFISPTGFEGVARDKMNGTRGKEWLRKALSVPLWKRQLFKAMTTKTVIRKFLEKTWGSRKISEPLLEYDYLTAHQPGAEHAPFYFIAGHLFGKDILRIYCALKLPVWAVRGTRGDFVDYHHLSRLADRPNWIIDQLDTGAFPHFESINKLTDLYKRFLQTTLISMVDPNQTLV